MRNSWLFVLFLALQAGPLVAQPAEGPLQGSEAEPSSALPEQGQRAESDESPANSSFDTYVPSESIAEDFAVPFPVDI